MFFLSGFINVFPVLCIAFYLGLAFNSIQFKNGLLKHVSQLKTELHMSTSDVKKTTSSRSYKEKDIKQEIIIIYIVKNTLVRN